MSPWRKAWRGVRRHKSGMVGLGIVGVVVVLAVFADVIAPVDPFLQNPARSLTPPLWEDGGLTPHLLGTDVLGRDLFSRLLQGARLSVLIGFISVLVGAGIGVPIGLISGYWGGIVDTVAMRFIDVMMAFPAFLLALTIVAILGPSLENAMIAIGVVAVPTYARVVRASVLSEKEKEYVQADVALGRRQTPILFRAILPNVLSPLLVISTLSFAGAVLEAAGLSFVGLGAQPPTPEWGALLFEGRTYSFTSPWLMIFPGLAILFTVMGFNLFGDALRDVLDPKSLKGR